MLHYVVTDELVIVSKSVLAGTDIGCLWGWMDGESGLFGLETKLLDVKVTALALIYF